MFWQSCYYLGKELRAKNVRVIFANMVDTKSVYEAFAKLDGDHNNYLTIYEFSRAVEKIKKREEKNSRSHDVIIGRGNQSPMASTESVQI